MVANNYNNFKKEVLKNCGKVCENPNCDADANQVHHFFKQSTFPQFKLETLNGMGVCGLCHSEIERRLRQGENWKELIPVGRYEEMEGLVND